MARKKKEVKIIPHKFNEDVENIVTKIIIDQEYEIAKVAKQVDNSEFESVVDMMECIRSEKDYDWMSDIFIPELPSIILTDASGWANQYFQTREFVKAKLEGQADDVPKCRAAEKCINQTLNNKNIYHYQKYIRGRTINSLMGHVYAICWWEQEIIPDGKIVGYEDEVEELSVDREGNGIVSEDQVPATRTTKKPIYEDLIVKDHFNYEIIDPRNVVTPSIYTYSVQQKDWIDIRSEVTYEDLKRDEKKNGYVNLELVKELTKNQGKTKTSQETYNKGEVDSESSKPVVVHFDRVLRFGKFWAIVKEKTREGYPKTVEPGYDELGEIKEDAELVDAIIETIISGGTKILIRFQPNGFRDSRGNTYYTVIRGLCYIHPTKDIGLSDGKFLRELQIATNDGFNMAMDREKLATIPTMKGNKHQIGPDNPTIYFAPEHVMELEDKDAIEEFKISSNVDGMIGLTGMLTSKMQQVSSVYPTTMGQLPEKASTTATAVAGAETRSNSRANYKSLTYEYTFLTEFYWIILQMTYQFARKETLIKMVGEDAEFFDPDADYTYSPVSSNIETEYNKRTKLQMIDQFVGRLVNVPNPGIWKMLNYLMSMAFELYDKEFPEYKKYLLPENVPPPEARGGGGGEMGGAENTAGMNVGPTSNQMGNEMSGQEQYARAGWR